MLDKFDLETLYIFDENKYYLYNGKKFNWTNLCHGLIVEPENEYMGTVKVDKEEYVVFPYSCNKIEVDVKSMEEKNPYGHSIKGTIQTKSSFQEGEPQKFVGKIYLDVDKNDNSEELTFNEDKEYYFDVDLVNEKDIGDWMYRCDCDSVKIINVNEGFVYDILLDTYHIVFREWCRMTENN